MEDWVPSVILCALEHYVNCDTFFSQFLNSKMELHFVGDFFVYMVKYL